MSIESFVEDLRHWAQGEDNILAIGLCGSHARAAARPDSDIDLVIICRDPSLLLAAWNWAHHFGEVISIQKENYGLVQSLRAFYKNGREVEFGIAGVEWCDPPIDIQTARVIADGILPLHDPLGKLRNAIAWVNQRRGGHTG